MEHSGIAQLSPAICLRPAQSSVQLKLTQIRLGFPTPGFCSIAHLLIIAAACEYSLPIHGLVQGCPLTSHLYILLQSRLEVIPFF